MYDLLAEGLLGAARLTPSGPPSGKALRRSTSLARRCRTRIVFLSGVRIEVNVRWYAILGFLDLRAGYAG